MAIENEIKEGRGGGDNEKWGGEGGVKEHRGVGVTDNLKFKAIAKNEKFWSFSFSRGLKIKFRRLRAQLLPKPESWKNKHN